MATSMLPLVLLLLLSTSVLARNETGTRVEEHETRLINHTQDINYDRDGDPFRKLRLFVKPEPGFTGFHINVTLSDEKQYLSWFPATNDCFPRHHHWYGIGLGVSLDRAWHSLDLWFDTRFCGRECQIYTTLQDIRGVSVMAHGTSQWLVERPQWYHVGPYLVHGVNSTSFPVCTIPPASTTPPPPPALTTTTVMYIVLSAVVSVVASLVVTAIQAVVMFMCKRKRQDQHPATSNEEESSPPMEMTALPASTPRPPPDSEPHVYDDPNEIIFYDDVQDPRQQVRRQATEPAVYTNVPQPQVTEHIYEEIPEAGDDGEHREQQPREQEPVYAVVH